MEITWQTYLTVRACRSVGAPDRTAAATTSPGSLPSITRFGTGEKELRGRLGKFGIIVDAGELTRCRDQLSRCSLADDEPLPLQDSPF